MKPARFEYEAPDRLEDAVGLLARYEDAKVLAGGQSLVPLLNFRLARPGRLVDINRIAGLDAIERTNGTLSIGSLARHRDIEYSDLIASDAPILRDAATWIAHAAIRVRGTIGGSVAHNDPAAEYPAALIALGASARVASVRGIRSVPVDTLLGDWLATELEQDEVIVGIDVPIAPARRTHGLCEIARRRGDYAISGAVALVDWTSEGNVAATRIVVFGGLGRATRLPEAEAAVAGSAVSDEAIGAAVEAASRAVEPLGDIHASAAYRKHLTGVLVGRALRQAREG